MLGLIFQILDDNNVGQLAEAINAFVKLFFHRFLTDEERQKQLIERKLSFKSTWKLILSKWPLSGWTQILHDATQTLHNLIYGVRHPFEY